MEAERSANKYKQVEYIQSFVGEEFEAIVSGVSGFGFWAETIAHKCEGMVSITDLADIDDFELKEGEYALVGRHTGLKFGMGDKVTVRVVSANLEKRQIDYSPVVAGQPERKKRSVNARPERKGAHPAKQHKKRNR